MVFLKFQKTIYCKGMKLSSDIFTCTLFLYHYRRCHDNHQIPCRSCQKSVFFCDNSVVFSVFFFHETIEIYEFVHFIYILTWFCVNFHYFLNFCKNIEVQDDVSKMMGQMTSLLSDDIIISKNVSFCRATSALCNLCKFIYLWLNRTKTKRGVLSAPTAPWWGYELACASEG